jgi:hypothetical protein
MERRRGMMKEEIRFVREIGIEKESERQKETGVVTVITVALRMAFVLKSECVISSVLATAFVFVMEYATLLWSEISFALQMGFVSR